MQTAGIIVLFAVISIAATMADNACQPSEVVKFAVLYSNPHLLPCQEVSAGFSIAPPKGYPTGPQVRAMCASDACRLLIKDVLELKPNDCYLSFDGVELNAYKLATKFEDECKHEKSSKDDDTSWNTDNDHNDDKDHPAPKPTEPKYYPTTKPSEHDKDDKYHQTPKPSDHKYPKTTEHDKDDKDHSKPKSTEYDYKHEMEASSSTGNEGEVEEQRPPMNGTAESFHPMPNTTYKAERL
ncbi:hypothetical protein PHYBOEH_007301 [Phytophthora boehmeriae]|uniref:Elicitin n=1 Tax=Phytophthora boehmeriae TaxID=109152 RepID=A0A8T1X7F7_9STRA|nr:hypothetical protein PHYBOEH_007301 [Phytophthora boehmeriae]